MMKKLTINQIAKLADVSKGTVSKVLNNYPHVSDEMRERVMKVVNQTGFQRHHVAQLLASSRSNIIGLIIPSGAKSVFADPYFAHLTESITRSCNVFGLTLSLLLFYAEQENISATKNIITNGLLDGVILSGDRRDNDILPWLIQQSTRFVFLGRPDSTTNQPIHFVDVDNFAGGKMATDHLLSSGHRRIGFIGCNINWAGEHRYDGYRVALAEGGIDYDPNLVIFGDFSPESAYDAMTTLIKVGVDAVFVISDNMALSALKCIREHGLSVPDDISVIGFDDLPMAHQAAPNLTTIRQPIQKQAHLAVETLIKIIETPHDAPHQIILSPELVIRGTTQ